MSANWLTGKPSHWITGKLVNWLIAPSWDTHQKGTPVRVGDRSISQLTNYPVNKFGESGATLVALAAGVGTVVGLVAVGVMGITGSARLAVHHAQGNMEGVATQQGQVWMGAAFLAQRLQDENLPPVTADDFEHLLPGATIEDEGGKLSIPHSVYALPMIMEEFGVTDVSVRVKDLAAVIGLSMFITENIAYPWAPPRRAMVPVTVFERPEELASYWELPGDQVAEIARWFTSCDTVGMNANTADPRSVMGVVKWQRAASTTWAGRVALGIGSPNSPIMGTFAVHVFPLPGQEPVSLKVPPERPNDLLETALPTTSLFPTDPSTPYNPLWQLVKLATDAPINTEIGWLVPPGPYNKAYWASGVESFPGGKKYSRDAYHVRGNAWVKGQPVSGASSLTGQRPLRLNDLTQPVGLLWYTPEAWFTPVTPAALGRFSMTPVHPDRPYKEINVGLAAASFTGWLSLQGPGPFRAGSEWYTITARSNWMSIGVAAQATLRIFPDEMPTVVYSAVTAE